MRIGAAAAAVWAAVIAVGCGSDDSSEAEGCVPGESVACTGPNSCSGYQVCDDDGQGYGPCECGAASGGTGATSGAETGGVEAASGGSTQPGSGGGTQPGSGGGTTSGAGGTGAESGGAAAAGASGGALLECEPQDVSSWEPEPYVPARTPTGDCTEALIQQYTSECLNAGSCAAFDTGGEYAACGACLTPTPVGASEYGPLVLTGAVRETNLAGCLELLGEADCAEHQQAKSSCERQACAEACPVTDAESLALYQQCKEEARTGVCDAYRQAAVCIADPAHAEACTGDSFEAALLAVGMVFCGG